MGFRVECALALALAIHCADAIAAEPARARQPVTRGNPTSDDAFVVALLDEAGAAFCTGALISSRDVLTAAHCLGAPAPALAFAGFGEMPSMPERVVPVEPRWVHPQYDPVTQLQDLALVRLADEVRDVVLPELTDSAPSMLEGTEARVVGFGSDGIRAGVARKRTGTVQLETVERNSLTLRPSPATPCVGDSGGPVLLDRRGAPQLIGVVSHGDPFCAAAAVATPVRRDDVSFTGRAEPSCSLRTRHVPRPWWTACAALTGLMLVFRRMRRGTLDTGPP
jgi:secreted trypsin-like serine protease